MIAAKKVGVSTNENNPNSKYMKKQLKWGLRHGVPLSADMSSTGDKANVCDGIIQNAKLYLLHTTRRLGKDNSDTCLT